MFAAIDGANFPLFGYLWGKLIDSFLSSNSSQEWVDHATFYRNIFIFVGIGILVVCWISFTCWAVVSERMAARCRKAYLVSLLRQDIGWFDQNNQFELSSRFSKDTIAYQRATGEKVGSIVMLISIFLIGPLLAIIVRWTMGLVILAGMPVILAVSAIFIYLVHKKNSIYR